MEQGDPSALEDRVSENDQFPVNLKIVWDLLVQMDP